jgi:hypothetical protein
MIVNDESNNVEGNGHGLIPSNILEFAWRDLKGLRKTLETSGKISVLARIQIGHL